MKKRPYRSLNVKQVECPKLSAALGGGRVAVGVDVAKEAFFAVFMTEQRLSVLTVHWAHPRETPAFLELLEQLRSLSPSSTLEVALEPSGTYGDILRHQLLAKGIGVFRVSPKRVHDAAEVYDGVASQHDAKASAIIAKLHLDGASQAWPVSADHERSFAAATKQMAMFAGQFQQGVNRLEAELARYWPELPLVLDLSSATLLTLVAEFGTPSAVADDVGKARKLMRATGRGALGAEKIETVLKDAASSLGVCAVKRERRTLMALAKEMLRCAEALRKSKQEVESMTANVPSVAAMSTVVGKVTSAVLVAEAGAPENYDSAAAFEKSLGLNLKERSSGKHRGKLKITKRGSGTARQFLYMAVLRLLQTDPVVKAWYAKKVKRDGGIKMIAIVAIMRKLARALWYVAQGATFDSRKLFDARRLNLKAAA